MIAKRTLKHCLAVSALASFATSFVEANRRFMRRYKINPDELKKFGIFEEIKKEQDEN